MSAGITFIPSPGVEAVDVKARTNGVVETFEATSLAKASNVDQVLRSKATFDGTFTASRYPLNSFIGSIVMAYNVHHKLILRPDDVWLAVVAQFSCFMKEHAEEVREHMVDFDGKQTIEVSDGDLIAAGLPISDADGICWESFVHVTGDKISGAVRDPTILQWAEPNFSTSTAVDRVIGRGMLMAVMQKFFNYKFSLCCGFPEITLLGTPEDWADVRKRADWLLTLNHPMLNKWHAMLTPVLDKFVETAQGEPDLEWWTRACDILGGGSGPRYLSGWVTVFTAFADTNKWVGDTTDVKIRGRVHKSEWPIINTNDVGPAVTTVPVDVDNNGDKFKATLVCGYWGASVPASDTLQPNPAWLFTRNKE